MMINILLNLVAIKNESKILKILQIFKVNMNMFFII